MTSSIYGMTNYYNLFTSPLKSSQESPLNNLIYVASANKMYMDNFAQKTSSEMSSYLSALNSSISDLKAASKPLSTDGLTSSFNQKSVASTDSGAVAGTALSNADLAAYTINVSKLAKSQTNTGKVLNSNDSSVIGQGSNFFSIKVGNKTEKNITFNINETDTNKSSLGKMASAINYAKVGVTASVINDSTAGTSYLKIVSDKTGTDSGFTITDKTGNAVSATESVTTTTVAQNAEYKIDGKQYTSQQNTVNLNNDKVNVTLNKAENKDIKVTIGSDTNAIKSDIKDFLESYNNTINLANTYSSSFSGASTLKSELKSITNSRMPSLYNIGIKQNSDGTLSLDEKKLDKALSENISQVKDTFSGFNGIAQKAYNKSNDVLNSPVKYSKPT